MNEGIYLHGSRWTGWRLVVIDSYGNELTTLAGPCQTMEEVLQQAMAVSGEPVLIRVG
jgi:hypothetical protein